MRVAAEAARWGKHVVDTELDEVRIGPEGLVGLLGVPRDARGLVVFAHGSGSGRLSPRNQYVAARLRQGRLATLLLDLLTAHEERDRTHVFDIALLADRLGQAVAWSRTYGATAGLPIAFFGASTGAGAALVAASREGSGIAAVVSRGGRPDLAGPALESVAAPTLLVVGGLDTEVVALNESALARLQCPRDISIVPGAGHLFEQPGTLDVVVRLAAAWFDRFLPGAQRVGENASTPARPTASVMNRPTEGGSK